MKQILLLTILVLVFCWQGFGQENANCPAVKLQSQTNPIFIGENLAFTVLVDSEAKNLKLEYTWAISDGTILSGQGTSALVVKTNYELENQIITAILEIKGLPEGCKSIFSESREVKIRQIIIQDGDEENTFNGNTPLDDYLARIQNLTLGLQGEKGSKGVIIFKFTKPSEQKKAIAMKKKLLKTSKIRKISLDGIEIKIEKGKVYETTVEFVSAESKKSN